MYTEDPSGVSAVYITPQNLMCKEYPSGASSVYITPKNLMCTEDPSCVYSAYISPQNYTKNNNFDLMIQDDSKRWTRTVKTVKN